MEDDGAYLFLSYARVDAPIVGRVAALLGTRGWKTWVDSADIPSASDWMSAIRAGIEQAAGFVFVLTPHSLASRMCRVELSIATEFSKRLLPLRPIDAATWAAETAKVRADPNVVHDAEIPAELAKLDYVDLADFAGRPDPFAALVDELVLAASRDLDWLQRHSRLQQDVKRWVDTRYAPSVLLREPLLSEAEQMLGATDKDPQLTKLQREFVTASRTELTSELEREAAQLAERILALPAERLPVGLLLALEGREKYLATPRLDGALRTLFSRWPQRLLITHEAPIHSIAFSLDGAAFITAAGDGVRIVDSTTGRLLRQWRREVPATWAGFLADGATVAVGWADGCLQLLGLDDAEATEYRMFDQPIAAVVQSPDGAHLAVRGGASLDLLNLREGARLRLPPHPGAVGEIRWRSASQIVSACEDGQVRVFDLAAARGDEFRLPANPVDSVVVAGGAARHLLAAGQFEGLVVVDPEARSVLEHVRYGSGTALGLTISDGEERIASQNVHGTVFVLDAASHETLLERNVFRGLAQSLTLGPRGELLGVAARHGVASVITVESKREQILAGHDGRATAIVIDAGGRRALTAGEDRTARLWELGSVPGRTSLSVATPLHAEISHDGARIVTAARDGAARLFDRASGTQLWHVPGVPDTLRSASFTADDTQLLLAYADGRMVVVAADGGQVLRSLQGAALASGEEALQSDDGKWLLTPRVDQAARILDSQTGLEASALAADTRRALDDELIRRARLVAARARLAYAARARDAHPRLYTISIDDGEPRSIPAPSHLSAALLSADGAYVFGAAIDRPAIYVFDSLRDELIATLALEHNANDLDLSEDGRWLLASWLDCVTAVPFPAMDVLLASLRLQLHRGLSDPERREFGLAVEEVRLAGRTGHRPPPEFRSGRPAVL